MVKINEGIHVAYGVVEEIMQEVILAEEEALSLLCFLLECENKRFNSMIIKEVISVLNLWGKIPANEIKARCKGIEKMLDKT